MATRASPPRFSPTALPELSTALNKQHRFVSLGRKPSKKDPNNTPAIRLKCVTCNEKAGHYCAAVSCSPRFYLKSRGLCATRLQLLLPISARFLPKV